MKDDIEIFFNKTFLLSSLYSQTVKDISNVIGGKRNQLIGYGLIVGLAGTGDKSNFYNAIFTKSS